MLLEFLWIFATFQYASDSYRFLNCFYFVLLERLYLLYTNLLYLRDISIVNKAMMLLSIIHNRCRK